MKGLPRGKIFNRQRCHLLENTDKEKRYMMIFYIYIAYTKNGIPLYFLEKHMIKSINCNYCHFVRKYPNIFPTHSRFTHSISSLIPTEGQRINVKCRPLNYMFNSTAHLAKDGILSICDYLRWHSQYL